MHKIQLPGRKELHNVFGQAPRQDITVTGTSAAKDPTAIVTSCAGAHQPRGLTRPGRTAGAFVPLGLIACGVSGASLATPGRGAHGWGEENSTDSNTRSKMQLFPDYAG